MRTYFRLRQRQLKGWSTGEQDRGGGSVGSTFLIMPCNSESALSDLLLPSDRKHNKKEILIKGVEGLGAEKGRKSLSQSPESYGPCWPALLEVLSEKAHGELLARPGSERTPNVFFPSLSLRKRAMHVNSLFIVLFPHGLNLI